jgi:tRNA pseudouridine55 synthase
MRSLARDLAISLGTVGHISALRRLKVGFFKEKNAISLDSLEVLAHSPQTFEHILPVEVALDGIPAISLSGDQATRMKNGQSISINEGMEWRCSVSLEEGDLLYAMSSGKPVAISRIREGFVSPIRVLNL